MSFESLLAGIQRLSVSVEALATVGAELRLQQQGLDGDPRVRPLLNEAVRAVDPQLLENIDINHQAAALALIHSTFRQALDLLENPARAPGWSYTDPEILQSQGRVSRLIVRGIETMARQLPELSEALRRPGAFLDVGTGTGWLALEAARSWPSLRVVGIDPWEPALTLARENLGASEVVERVEFRRQSVELLQEEAAFSLAWLPGPFIAAEFADRALERVHRALVPGGWLIFGSNPPLPGPLAEALASLRIVRSGGYPWTAKEVEEKLRTNGFDQIQVYSPASPILFVAGRRPVS
jgi:ubiquinone/menaquinone biosynthesis C-methylase UbiE